MSNARLEPGRYFTASGHIAIVAKVKSFQGQFALRGAIIAPDGALCPHHWTLDGQSHAAAPDGRQCDLVAMAVPVELPK